MRIVRNYFYKKLSIDTGAFPCPRCRSDNVTNESGMCGQIATCIKCGARSALDRWNDGFIDMDKVPNKTYYEFVDLKFKRPLGEKVEIHRKQSGRQKLYDEVEQQNKSI